MPCAPGTAFNPVDCQCSLTLMTIPGKVRQGTADSFSLNIYIFVRYTCNILYGSHKMKANEKSEIINNDVSCPVKWLCQDMGNKTMLNMAIDFNF